MFAFVWWNGRKVKHGLWHAGIEKKVLKLQRCGAAAEAGEAMTLLQNYHTTSLVQSLRHNTGCWGTGKLFIFDLSASPATSEKPQAEGVSIKKGGMKVGAREGREEEGWIVAKKKRITQVDAWNIQQSNNLSNNCRYLKKIRSWAENKQRAVG